ncbi:hypothetical protein CIB84_009099 [Bambusicola thoracicus]|uniref:Uncharacterized protein n=1 Tax=Bambusicola thoracicus TaxID=9083 RepID=A0A2P4SST0_BAMTH|nr:hypothetical protein CIB84_009099 [Bambusicola thoracicus]
MAIFSAVLALILVNLLKAQGTPVTPVLEETSVEQSRDLNMQPSSKFPVEYSRDPYKEEGMEKTGNTGVQEGEQATWEISGEPSTETTPNSSVESNEEQTQKPTTAVSGSLACQ